MPHAYITIDRQSPDKPALVFLHIGPENAHSLAYTVLHLYMPALRAMGSYERTFEIYRGKDVMLINSLNDVNKPFHVSVDGAEWQRISFEELVEDFKATIPVKEEMPEPSTTNDNA